MIFPFIVEPNPHIFMINVLIVDDFEVDRYTYTRYLQSDSDRVYQITEAETLKDGLAVWRSQHPDIVLLDINLPDGNGLGFLEIIGNENPKHSCSVIFLVGQGNEQLAVQSMRLGAADYLIKSEVSNVSLITSVRQAYDRLQTIKQLERSQRQQILVAGMALKIRKSIKLEDISNAIVREVHDFLEADRVLVYQFEPDMSGSIVAEVVNSPWTPILNAQIHDHCFKASLGGAYREGRFFAAADIYAANILECHVQLLERFQVRANLVVPILVTNTEPKRLWGLLIAHQCSAPRQWQELDIQLLQQLSVHLGIAIQQAELYQDLQNLNESLEQKVKERTAKLQLHSRVLEEIHDAVVTTDPNGIVIHWSRGAENLYGYSAEEALGKSIEFIYENHHILQTDVISPLLAQGEHNVETFILTKLGERLCIDLRLSVVKDDQGNITDLIGCANNITQRKYAEQELRELNHELRIQTERLSLALKSGLIGFWTWDIVQNTKIWDERMYELYGIDQNLEESNHYDTWISRLHPEDRSSVEALLQQAVLGLAEYDIEFRIIHPQDGTRFLKAYGKLQRDELGNPQRMTGINYDISNFKRLQHQLTESEAKYRHLVEGMNVLTWSTDIDGIFTYLSPQFTSICGWEVNEWLGKSSFELVHPDDLAYLSQLKSSYNESPKDRKTHNSLEFRHLHRDGHYFWVSVNNTSIVNSEGLSVGIQGILTDISDRKETEIKLQRINEELLKATKLKDEFLANMSHELRTPLNAILGMSEALEEGVLGDLAAKQIKAVNLISKSGEHLLSLINDILDLSKVASGKMELHMELVSVKALCDSSLAFVKQKAFQKNINVTCNIPENISSIVVDERRMKQVLINLLTNAVKFTAIGGKIELSVRLDESMILFQVRDNGIGIAAKDLHRLFQAFVQIDSTLTREYEGTGLGLAMVKQIVELHGGQVSVESQLAEGSCFTIALPTNVPHLITVTEKEEITANMTAGSTVAADSQSNSQQNYLILIAEDNEANISTFREYLYVHNYRIVSAKDGIEAVALAESHRPDIILMDIQMPKMDGIEATRLIKANPELSAIPIIALTAHTMEDDRAICLDAGANEYISKPVRLKHLLNIIQQFLPN